MRFSCAPERKATNRVFAKDQGAFNVLSEPLFWVEVVRTWKEEVKKKKVNPGELAR